MSAATNGGGVVTNATAATSSIINTNKNNSVEHNSSQTNAVAVPTTTQAQAPEKVVVQQQKQQSCPYLDTINRSLLDFDFEHSCSVTLQSGPHVYGCLICGKFFRGRGKQTPAYTHSVDTNHAVYVHLDRGTFHCLPDDYEIVDASLKDIGDALHPVFSKEEIQTLDLNTGLARDLFGRRYLPGFVGLNNLNKTDYINATVQALAHVRPLRDFFLRLGHPASAGGGGGGGKKGTASSSSAKGKSDNSNAKKKKRKRTNNNASPTEYSDLALCFGELIRKMWSDKRFKSNVDPHMLVQAVSVASKKRFHIGKQAEAGEFLAWLLHQLHLGLGGTRKVGSSVIHEIFMGSVEVTTRQRRRGKSKSNKSRDPSVEGDDYDEEEEEEEDDREGSDDEEERKAKQERRERRKAESERMVVEETTADTQFLQLTLDIPEKPLFKDDDGGLVIPQEPLVSVLQKFDGMSFSDALGKGGVPQKRRYRLKKLPNYLILHLARFKKNNFYTEKNPTIVAFPVKNLDLSRYVFPEGRRDVLPKEEEVRAMSVKELKNILAKYGQSHLAQTIIDKSDLIQTTLDFVTKSLPDVLADKYDLVANITHNTPAEVGREGRRDPLEEGSYRCHVQHTASKQWYEMQDLHVQETMPQLIGLSESYVLIFERKGILPKKNR